MEKALLNYLRASLNFEKAYSKALKYVHENINSKVGTLELSEDTNCNMVFPITEDNLFVLGLDEETLTIWIFFDEQLFES